MRVLVVDDNEDLVEMLGIAVGTLGHHVQTARDGAGAVSAATNCRPDVALLDLGLPGMTGLEVARELRRRPETAHAVLVALTGWGDAEDRVRTRDAGFDHHLTKPADPHDLAKLLAEIEADLRAG